MSKYAQYFNGNEILPNPVILEKLEPRILSLVVTDLKTRRLVGLKKEAFEDLLRKAGVPSQYFCRRSFVTWDVLLPSKEQAAKVASTTITTEFFRRQPEYMGTCRIPVTVCNVPAFITGEVLVAFFGELGRVEEINLLRSAAGTAYGDYAFRLCLKREGFQAIPEVIISRERQMMVVVEGRCQRCWGCKHPGHIAEFWPQKDQQNAAATAATTATTVSTATIIQRLRQPRIWGRSSPNPPIKQKRTKAGSKCPEKKKRKSPNNGENKPASASPAKNSEQASTLVSTTEPIPVTSTPVTPPAPASSPAQQLHQLQQPRLQLGGNPK